MKVAFGIFLSSWLESNQTIFLIEDTEEHNQHEELTAVLNSWLSLLPETIQTLQEIKKQEETGPYKKLSRFLKSSHALSVPSVFSSDNSLLSCYTYGVDIYDLIQTTKKVADHLLLDERLDHDLILNSRQISWIKPLFIGKDGSFPDVGKSLGDLRYHSLRLAEGLELRQRNPELGIHTFKNLATASMVLQDLDAFFTEIFHEYRKRGDENTATNRRGG